MSIVLFLMWVYYETFAAVNRVALGGESCPLLCQACCNNFIFIVLAGLLPFDFKKQENIFPIGLRLGFVENPKVVKAFGKGTWL